MQSLRLQPFPNGLPKTSRHIVRWMNSSSFKKGGKKRAKLLQSFRVHREVIVIQNMGKLTPFSFHSCTKYPGISSVQRLANRPTQSLMNALSSRQEVQNQHNSRKKKSEGTERNYVVRF